jgi:hypothetical protein
MTLAIPTHRDPVARTALVACALALAWLAITGAMPPARAQEQPQVVIVVATPTLPVSQPTLALIISAPTAAIPTAMPPQPTEVPPVVIVEAPPAPVLMAPTEPPAPEQPHIGERGSDKAGPGTAAARPVMPEK